MFKQMSADIYFEHISRIIWPKNTFPVLITTKYQLNITCYAIIKHVYAIKTSNINVYIIFT